MPYSSWKDTPPHVKKRGQEAAELWLTTWKSVMDETGDESKANAAANSLIGSRITREKRIAMVSDVFEDWNAAGKYEVEYIRSGYWSDFNGQGELYVTNVDIADGVEAFQVWKKNEGWKTDKRRPFLDYSHGITNPKLSDKPNVAAGWMADAWIEDMDGKRVDPAEARTRNDVLRIKVAYEVNDDANNDIKTKQRALFSPTFITPGENEKTGESWKFEIVGGALTNIPFFEGLDDFVPMVANATAARAFAVGSKYRSGSTLCVRLPDSGDDLEGKIKALEALGFEIESFYQGPMYAYAQRPSASKRAAQSGGSGSGGGSGAESEKPADETKGASPGDGLFEVEVGKSTRVGFPMERGSIEVVK